MKFNINPFANMLKAFPFVLILLIVSCKKTDKVETLTLEELYPLKIGKYITYRLDSTVFINAGKLEVINRYRVRHIVEQKIKDNLNRDGWRVNVYINDSLGLGPWVPSSSYFVIPNGKELEVIENNLRVIQIKLPAKEGFTWLGNQYLPDRPYNPLFPLTLDAKLSSWDFVYESINQTEKIGNLTVNDVTSVTHKNDTSNFPIWNDTSYASREFLMDKYAKNTGLVYREYVLREYQTRARNTGIPPVTTYDPVWIGFGIKMWMIDKN